MKNGFTLIEILIYITILAMAVGGITLVAMNIFEVSARTNAIQEIAYNGRFAMHRIGHEIKNSTEIISPETEGNTLSLIVDDTEITFMVDENKLRMKKNEETFDITISRVNVENINFTKISDDSVRIEMNISHSNPQNLPTQEFSNFFTGAFTIK